jgi:hypothetical protein
VSNFQLGGSAEGDGAELENLKNGEGQGEEGGPDQIEGKTEQRHEGKHDIGEGDKAVMKRDGALPAKTAEQRAAPVFLVIHKGWEVEDKKVCERQRGERNDKHDQQAVIFPGLKQKANGGDDIGNVRGKDQFAEAAVGEAKGINGIYENKKDGGKQKEEGGQGQRVVEINDERQ